jgi:hypothetical protein
MGGAKIQAVGSKAATASSLGDCEWGAPSSKAAAGEPSSGRWGAELQAEGEVQDPTAGSSDFHSCAWEEN